MTLLTDKYEIPDGTLILIIKETGALWTFVEDGEERFITKVQSEVPAKPNYDDERHKDIYDTCVDNHLAATQGSTEDMIERLDADALLISGPGFFRNKVFDHIKDDLDIPMTMIGFARGPTGYSQRLQLKRNREEDDER